MIKPTKWDILPKDSLVVMKRLVRELNGTPDGFYLAGRRYHRARLHGGILQVRGFVAPYTAPCWINVESTEDTDAYFTDAYGGHICASRTRCGSGGGRPQVRCIRRS